LLGGRKGTIAQEAPSRGHFAHLLLSGRHLEASGTSDLTTFSCLVRVCLLFARKLLIQVIVWHRVHLAVPPTCVSGCAFEVQLQRPGIRGAPPIHQRRYVFSLPRSPQWIWLICDVRSQVDGVTTRPLLVRLLMRWDWNMPLARECTGRRD
jgi:hypothetical protein